MLARLLHHRLATAPLLAVVLNLVLAAIAVASTGGGDWPVLKR